MNNYKLYTTKGCIICNRVKQLIESQNLRIFYAMSVFFSIRLKRSSENEKHPLIGVNSFFRRPLYILTI